MQGIWLEHLWNDTSNMYIDFSALVNVTSKTENILDINFNYALLNGFVEVTAMELDGSILTMECACVDTRISAIWKNYYNTMWIWGSKQYSKWKWYATFLLFLNGVSDGSY